MVDEGDDDPPALEVVEEDSNEEEEDEDKDDVDDGIDELEELSDNEWAWLLADTVAVRATITKVRNHETEDVYNANHTPTGTATFFRDNSFDDDRTPCLAPHLC